jgi:peptide/nickel transport system permease protein
MTAPPEATAANEAARFDEVLSSVASGSPSVAPAPTTVKGPGRVGRLLRDPKTLVPLVMLSVLFVLIVIVPFLPGYSPYTQNLNISMEGPFAHGHLLGTDTLGRDTLSRLALGGRWTIAVAAAAVAINAFIGIVLGLIAGYFSRRVESVIMILIDLQLSIPLLLLLIGIVAVIRPGPPVLALILGVTNWVGYGRIARATTKALKNREFVLAPKAAGASSFWIIRKHLFPALISQTAILMSFNLGVMITVLSSLDFLGLGVPPPTPTWGGMIAEGQPQLQVDYWLVLIPGIAIFLLIAGVNALSRRFTTEGDPS